MFEGVKLPKTASRREENTKKRKGSEIHHWKTQLVFGWDTSVAVMDLTSNPSSGPAVGRSGFREQSNGHKKHFYWCLMNII